MARIHHMTRKLADKAGIKLEIVENEVEASKDGVTLASHPDASVALKRAVEKLGVAGTVKAIKAEKAKAAPKPKKPAKVRKASDDEDGDESEDEDGDESEDEDGDESEDEGGGKSIVKRKYKKQYRPFKMTCGDDLAQQIKAHVSREDEEAGGMRVDVTRLRAFARANDCWVPDYAKLNVGQQRMNVGNRLRAKVRKGHVIVWA